MKRINVVGVSGSGKSTLGRQLATALDIPFIEMDAIYWKPDWEEPEDEEFFGALSEAIRPEEWVLDGNYSRTTELKWARADTVIWINYSFVRTLFQLITRSIKRARDQEEIWPGTGNVESIYRSFFTRKSVIWWMLTNYRRVNDRYRTLMKSNRYNHIRFIRLTSPAQARKMIESLTTHKQAQGWPDHG